LELGAALAVVPVGDQYRDCGDLPWEITL